MKKGCWEAAEDEVIRRLVQQGVRRWSVIATHVPGRTGKQCRERYHNHLDSDLNKLRWSDAEEAILVSLQQQLGNKWSTISRQLPGRYVPLLVACRCPPHGATEHWVTPRLAGPDGIHNALGFAQRWLQPASCDCARLRSPLPSCVAFLG
jgi:hypothetical protein